jgi:hypothetical protein
METKKRTPQPKFTHGQDAGKVALALWLMVSPWILNYSEVRLPVWNGFAVAIVVAAFSIAAMLKCRFLVDRFSLGFRLYCTAGDHQDAAGNGQSSRRRPRYRHPIAVGVQYLGASHASSARGIKP